MNKADKKKWCYLITISVFIFVYILQMFRAGVGSSFSFQDVAVILFNAFLLGIFAYIITTFIFWLPQRLKQSFNTQVSSESPFDKIISNDLCDICDEVTDKLHRLVINSLPLTKFESDVVDGMNQGIATSWLTPCVAYSYGLVAIGMLKRDFSFLQSNVNKELQDHVLHRMAATAKETSSICKAEESTNQELVDEITEDLKVVIHAVFYYFNKLEIEDHSPFKKLIGFLKKRIHRDLPQKLPGIESITAEFLADIDTYIDQANNLQIARKH